MTFTKRIYISIFYLILALAYIYFIEHYYGWHFILQSWTKIEPIKLAGAFCLILVTWYIRALRVCDYFSLPWRDSISSCLKVVLLHNLINSIFPIRSGEASFPLLMKKEFSLSIAKSTTALVILRLLDLHVLLMTGLILYLILQKSVFLLDIAIPTSIALPLLLLSLKEWISKKISSRDEFIGKKLLLQIISAVPERKSILLRSWLLTALCWIIKIIVYGLIAFWFSSSSLIQTMLAAFAGELGSIIPIHTPGALGTYEAGMLGLSRLFGLQGDWIMLTAVQLHLVIIVSTLLGGIVAIFIRGHLRNNLERSIKG